MQISIKQDYEYKDRLKEIRSWKAFTKSSPYNVGDTVYHLKSCDFNKEIFTLQEEPYKIIELTYYISGNDFAIPIYLIENDKGERVETQTPYAIYLKEIVDKMFNKQEHKAYTIFDFI